MYSPGNRCGLYILYFANNDLYAGQAIDVTRRFVQHRKIHNDIQKISFKRMAKRNLNEAELALIHSLERAGHSLRNITFTSVPKGIADFDLVMSFEEQKRWLGDQDYVDYGGPRVHDLTLRNKYSRKFQQFTDMPSSDNVTAILRRYVRTCLPAFLRSELTFWSCSCLPGNSNTGYIIHSRINVYWQEVCTVFEDQQGLGINVHLARSAVETAFGSSAGPLVEEYPTLRVIDHQYKPGGYDQTSLEIRGTQAVLRFLHDPILLHAIRVFNMRLMKKGACNYNRYHCFDLADRLVM
jgi:hypothetical protein